MKITSISSGTQITIELVYNDVRLIENVTVLTTYGGGLLITPICFDGKAIESCTSASFTLIDKFSGESRVFDIDSFQKVDFTNSEFHVITGKESKLITNNRRAERFKVSREATAFVGNNQTIKLVVNDISMRGVSLIVGKNKEFFPKGGMVEIELMKEDTFKRIHFKAVVVREFNIGSFAAVGCELKDVTAAVMEYILQKKKEHELKESEHKTLIYKLPIDDQHSHSKIIC